MSAQAFVRRLGAVPEPAMRLALWREAFQQREPQFLIDVMVSLFAALDRRKIAAEPVYLSLVRFFEDHGDAEHVQAFFDVVEAAGLDRLLTLRTKPSPMRTADPGELRTAPLATDRDVTLGERRSWARRHDRDVLDRLLYDADPGVIRNLLQNPRIIERDVTKIAARRPGDARILTLLFHHPRWGRNKQIQLALVMNPYTPADIARSLVAVLDRETARQVAREPNLHPDVRARAEAHAHGPEPALKPNVPVIELPDEPEPEDV